MLIETMPKNRFGKRTLKRTKTFRRMKEVKRNVLTNIIDQIDKLRDNEMDELLYDQVDSISTITDDTDGLLLNTKFSDEYNKLWGLNAIIRNDDNEKIIVTIEESAQYKIHCLMMYEMLTSKVNLKVGMGIFLNGVEIRPQMLVSLTKQKSSDFRKFPTNSFCSTMIWVLNLEANDILDFRSLAITSTIRHTQDENFGTAGNVTIIKQ